MSDIVAIGTSSGNILLYSIIKADIHSQLVSFFTFHIAGKHFIGVLALSVGDRGFGSNQRL